MSKQDGGPAFPQIEYNGYWKGMTLRDYFAAKAMGALISRTSVFCGGFDSDKQLVNSAYEYADAMLKEREK